MEQKQVVLGLDDDEEGNEDFIILVSSEKEKFKVPRKAAMLSKLVSTTLLGDSNSKEVPLFHIESAIVERIVEYMIYHAKVPPRQIEKPLASSNMADLVDSFDVEFCDTDQETMLKLLLAANYMYMKPLLSLMSAKVASLMKGLTPDQIRVTFNIRGDYTAEEEEQVRREHRDLLS